MTDLGQRPVGVSRGWRVAAIALGVALMGSWLWLGAAVLDSAISLDYCRVEQGHLQDDARILVTAGIGLLSLNAILMARSAAEPALADLGPEPDGTVSLASLRLAFNSDGLLTGLADQTKEANGGREH